MNRKNTLYIIGNGFDLAHGLKTSYQDFKMWLQNNQNSAFVHRIESLYPEIVNHDGEWNDIERALGIFDMEHVTAFDKYFTDCNCREDVNNDAGANIKNVVVVLHHLLRAWIESINLDNVKAIFQIEENSVFVNFNYTETLEHVYEIERTKVFHIHGSIKDKKQELIIGYLPEDDCNNNVLDATVLNDNAIRHNLMTNKIKPIRYCIDRLHGFFDGLIHVNEVRVIGHSCSRIDEPYFIDIAKSISKDAVWKFYIYDTKKEESYKGFANRITQQDKLKQKYEIKRNDDIIIFQNQI